MADLRLHARAIDASRRALLAAALAAAGLSATPVEAAPLPEPRPATVMERLLDFSRAGKPDGGGPAIAGAASGERESWLDRLPRLGGSPADCFGRRADRDMRVREAAASSLFLAVHHQVEDRVAFTGYGTGTVVARSAPAGAPDRLLTAAHVANPDVLPAVDGGELSHVLAFDASGRLLARLVPVAAMQPPDLYGTDPDALAEIARNDLAVLEVESFASPEAERRWRRLGVDLAPAQSDRVLMIADPDRRAAFDSGASGSGVFDAEDRLIGVVSFLADADAEFVMDRQTGFAAAILARSGDRIPQDLRLSLEAMDARTGYLRATPVGAVLAATPIRDPVILAALGRDPRKLPVAPLASIDGWFAGYPKGECRQAEIVVTPDPALEVAPPERRFVREDLLRSLREDSPELVP